MAALAALDGVAERFVVSVGFGVDAYHGVSHALVLENIAALERDGAYLGAFSLSRSTREGALFLDAVAHAQAHTADRPTSWRARSPRPGPDRGHPPDAPGRLDDRRVP